MAEYPFTLLGAQRSYNGNGRRDGETYKSPDFELEPGLVIAEIEHHGRGKFQLRFVPTEGFSEGEATAASMGGAFAAGAATGAAIGSIVPVAGTILGGLIGGAAGWLASGAIDDAIAPRIWTPVDYEGKLQTCAVARVSTNRDEEDVLLPGKYRLEVKSTSRWSCRFIQPALGQGMEFLITEPDDDTDDNELIEPNLFIVGPFKPVRRPLIARIQHNGGGVFDAEAFSVDGTHYCAVYQREGQFYVEDQLTDMIPGKEYIPYIDADGEWSLDFTEGY